MTSVPPSGIRSASRADQRRLPRRPCLADTERGHPVHQGTGRASLPSWGASAVGCGFGDGQGNHGATAEVNSAARKSSPGGMLGKVRTSDGW